MSVLAMSEVRCRPGLLMVLAVGLSFGASTKLDAESSVGDPPPSMLNEEKIRFEGVPYRVCRIPKKMLYQLKLAWLGSDGKPMRSFDRVQAHYEAKGEKVTFITNAGIFEPGGIPTGMHHQQFRSLRPLNLRPGKGNFFLKPNGVLTVSKSGARIQSSHALARLWSHGRNSQEQAVWSQKTRLAVQSGPLLLEGGRIHPAFRRASTSALHRNGVGVNDQGLIFVITDKEGWVNLHGFSRFFLHLGCKDALFLDGDISQMAVRPSGKVESNLFGAMLVMTQPAE
ncbi:phosphodiester glycosidase family protein [Verrucomicrobiaceae bacterium N1E253]|uniref:Phosphodiester glycosidase family protein n=2 Tax=Oceaniferula marina TaxID=2748318 RepID=A0A851GFB8_9BACT|nr:phosphodiester glycosidase family protein [Oceaniferula marina]